MKLTSALVAHNHFHKGSWLIPVKNPSWYYFAEQENSNHISNRDFLNSVDQPLKELVKFLHEHQIKTTPSCSGHFRNIKEYKKVYSILEDDMKHIRNGGLTLKDIETGKYILYQDKNYKLPWNKDQFLEEVLSYQHKGILGMRIENEKLERHILDLHVEEITITKIDEVVLLEIDTDDEEKNKKAWKEITMSIKALFVPYLFHSV